MMGDVLQKDSCRSALPDDAAHVGPEDPLVVDPALSSNRVGLTRVTGSEDVHLAQQRSSVEGAKVRPDRCRSQRSFFHARDQKRSGCCFPLHISHGNVIGEGEACSKFKPADSGT
jgi:hypothetical protein